MTKIRDIVHINSGYTTYVDLYEDYYDVLKNRGRMMLYKPISAHRAVFEKVANALNPKDRRFYFLSGSYGTGKSHLLLMLANFFANSSDLPELEAFFRNYADAQKEVKLKPGEVLNERSAASLKSARSSGRYLVALCRFNLNLDFEGAILRALEDAMDDAQENEGFTISMDTHSKEAIRRIRDWETRKLEARFYGDLEVELQRNYKDWTIDDLVEGLKGNQEDALKVFKACFRTVTDSDFTYKKDNIQDILTDFMTDPEFKERYKGIVILYDEFGSTIDDGLVNYKTMLGFAQYCANSTLEKGGPVIFISTGHKAFRNHGKVGDLNTETLEARVSEISLQTQGMEDIVAAIVQPKKDTPEWKSFVEPQSGKFTWFSNECNRLQLFRWLSAPKVKNNIIQNIYPMHPMATYAVLKLASEAGSDNRSVIKFFAPEFETGETGWKNVQPYSYPWFLEQREIAENNRLNLYTADLLVDYFQEDLKATQRRLSDRVKKAVVNYETTRHALNDYVARLAQGKLFDEVDELMLRIIKVMLIHDIISAPDTPIANTEQNILFSLDMSDGEPKASVQARLKKLCDAGVLFNNQGVYELAQGDRKDVYRLIEQYKANPDNRPTNVMESFLAFSPLKGDEQFLEAKDYNSQYSEDKRLKVVFATPTMLEATQMINGVQTNYFALLEQERMKAGSGPSGYEGAAVFVFCENDVDIEQAQKSCAKNDQERVVVATPRNPIKVVDPIFILQALKSKEFQKEAESFGPYEHIQVSEIRKTAEGALADAKADYFSNAKVNWFGPQGVNIPVQEAVRHDVANRRMQELFVGKQNIVKHVEFNKRHINLSGQVRAILKEAGDILCNTGQTIAINWTWADNRGGTKYLRKVFHDYQLLRLLNVDGDIRYMEPEKDVQRFKNAAPAYAEMLADLAALEGKSPATISSFITKYSETYGQGDLALTLMLLLARRYYGDSLRFKKEPGNLQDIQYNSTDDMIALIQGQSPNAIILFEPVSSEDKAYFAKVSQVFSAQPAAAGKISTIGEAFQAISIWWDALPIIARSIAFYTEMDKPFVTSLNQTKTKDPYQFIKHELLELLGLQPGEKISPDKLVQIETRLTDFKETARSILAGVENGILQQIATLFGAQTALDVDIQEALKNWHTGLGETQKDPLGMYHNNDSKPLVKYTQYSDIRGLLFKTYPEAYQLGPVSTWSLNNTAVYVQRLSQGKTHIETNAPQISQLALKFQNEVSQQGSQVTYKDELIIHADTEDGQGLIYYTDDGSDPRTNIHRKILKPGDTLTIKGNRKVKLVVADQKGNYGVIQTVEALDAFDKYKIKRTPQLIPGDEMINFLFPKDQDSATLALATFLEEIIKAGIYSPDELEQALLALMSQIKGQ